MKIFKLSIFLVMTILVMAGAVSAAPAWISSITDLIEGPFRVAIDASGNLYVTEPSKNLVVIYSSEGKYVKSFSVTWPLGIAVDAAGNIYVGSQTSGKPDFINSVEIYNSDLVHTGSLGIGKGEVGEPKDVAVGSDGKVYVVDKKNNRVKGYDPAAGSSFSFNGSFTLPTAIAVSNTAGVAGEAYVLDTPYDTAGVHNRIQVFDKSGQFLRSFIFKDGYTFNPMGIAADSAGLLYVLGPLFNSVFVFDPANGAPAAGTPEFTDPANSMRTLQGIAVSKNGLVYVASSGSREGKGRVDVFALDGSVTMAVDPLSLTFIGTQFAGNPDPQTIVIANTGSGTLNWSATADQTWINLGQQAPVGPKSAGGLAVGVNIAAFAAGSYSGTITIDSGFGQKQTVNVTVSVIPPPVLNISNGWLNFAAKKGTTPAAQGISIAVNNLTAPLSWSVASDSPSWLTISPAAGTASAAAPLTMSTVSVNTTGLQTGSYSGLLTVSAPGAIGTDSKITVNLTIAPLSKLAVQTNLADARFTVSGPATYSGSGASWSHADAPAGQYTVTFDAVTGYKKPFAQTRTLVENGETTIAATYVSWKDLAAKKNIIVAKGPDAGNDSRLKVLTANGAPTAFDLVALETQFGANVAVGDVDGDGSADLIVGAGLAADNPALVRIFRAVDKAQITSFTPFGSLNGVKVAAGDLNGDGKAEVIVSTPANGGELAVFTFENGGMVPTGITLPGEMLAAVADTEGDGLPEIVTAVGTTVKIWKIDLTGGAGLWTATMVKERHLNRAASSLAAADVNGDCIDEIIVGKTGTPENGARVVVIFADGTRTLFTAFPRYNFAVAAADLDGDGLAEIITGRTTSIAGGEIDLQESVVRVYSASGVLNSSLWPFGKVHDGINVAVGDLGL